MKTAALSKKRVFATFVVLAAVWLALDQLTKAAFNEVLLRSAPIEAVPGVLRFELVHNIGAAWGLFGGATVGLAILSAAVCTAVVIYLAKMWRQVNMLTVIGAALVVAGGVGNMIDRLAFGYVIDFISLAFMDFPVFNLADIGVTCGIVLFLIGLVVSERKV